MCQVIGRNKIGEIPKKIATYLGLQNLNRYTGHCFRRTGTTLLANSGANMTMIKQFGVWKSDNVAQEYIENSMLNRKNIFEAVTFASKIQVHNRPSTNKESLLEATSSTNANKENEDVVNWEDFTDDLEIDCLVPPTMHQSNVSDAKLDTSAPCASKVLSPIEKQSAPVFCTAKGLKLEISSEKTVTLTTEQSNVRKHFLSKSPILLPLHNKNSNTFQSATKRSKTDVENSSRSENENNVSVDIPTSSRETPIILKYK